MKLYEGLFVFPSNIAPEKREEQQKNLDELVKKFDGKIAAKQDWGLKQLGYEVRKCRDGYFSLWDFEMPASKVGEFRKSVTLSPDIIKYMIAVKKIAPPVKTVAKPAEKESAPASKSEA